MSSNDGNLKSCCGQRMSYKEGYGYTCERCGKEKRGNGNENQRNGKN